MLLKRLVQEAEASAQEQGHHIQWSIIGDRLAHGICSCGRYVSVAHAEHGICGESNWVRAGEVYASKAFPSSQEHYP
jgi:hypothetical protein